MFYGIKRFVLALQEPGDPVDIQALQRDAVLYMAAACAAMMTFKVYPFIPRDGSDVFH
jgi:hypothetical protein